MPKGPHGYTSLAGDSGELYLEKQEPRSDRTLFILLSLSLLCNVLVVSYWIAQIFQKPFSFPEAGYSPAQHAIAYRTVKFHRGLQDDIPIYERPPSVDVDSA
ncbi:hypothetical protein K438DRAFT_1979714 [Mycena galopus ATCC 62051]|nr:hypothetical protein K438DRAFT_1979714 [Mycena galopus ATCC 62051]